MIILPDFNKGVIVLEFYRGSGSDKLKNDPIQALKQHLHLIQNMFLSYSINENY